jgi:hypothetical protein
MTELDEFELAVDQTFAQTATELGLAKDPGSTRQLSHSISLTYLGSKVFVVFELDQRDKLFNVVIGPLVNGRVPPRPLFLPKRDEALTWYPLWALLRLRDEPLPPFTFAHRPDLDGELRSWVAALREQAGTLVNGDFSGFDDIHELLESNYAEGQTQLKQEVADLVQRARRRAEEP